MGESSVPWRQAQGGTLSVENLRTIRKQPKGQPAFHYHRALAILNNVSNKILLPPARSDPPLTPSHPHNSYTPSYLLVNYDSVYTLIVALCIILFTPDCEFFMSNLSMADLCPLFVVSVLSLS